MSRAVPHSPLAAAVPPRRQLAKVIFCGGKAIERGWRAWNDMNIITDNQMLGPKSGQRIRRAIYIPTHCARGGANRGQG